MMRLRGLPALVTLFAVVCLGPTLRAQQLWQPSPQDVTTANLWSVAYGTDPAGNNPTLIAVGERGTLLSFAYAEPSWQPRESATDAWLVGVGFGASRFVVVGDRGTILTSYDQGATWTPRTSGTTTRLNAVAYGNGRWLAIGELGVVLTSPDAITWSARPSLGTGFLRALAFGQGRFLLGGAGGRLFTTTDAENFSSVPLATTEDIEAAAISASRFFISGSNGLHGSAIQLSAWTLTTAGATTTLRGLATHSTEDATAVGDRESLSFRAGAWRTSFYPPAFFATAITRGLNEIVAVGFSGKISRTAFDSPEYIVCEPFPNVVYGGDARLRLITDEVPLSVQWTRNGSPIAGATTADFTLRNLTASGTFGARYTTAGGSYTVRSLDLTVVPGGRPTVIDPAFRSALPTTPDLVVPQPDGKLLVAGSFSVTLPFGTTRGLARLNPDGSLDANFRAGNGISVTGSITGFAPLADGRLYVWGTFTNIADQPRPGIALLNSDGSLDPRFPAFSFANPITRTAAAPDGTVYVQRGPDYLSGSGFPTEIVRITPDQRLSQLPTLAQRYRLVGVDALGRILAVDMISRDLSRYLPTGARDPNYQSASLGLSTYDSNSLLLTPNGIYAASYFGALSGSSGGISFERYNPEGGRDQTYLTPGIPFNSERGRWSVHFRADGQMWQVRQNPAGNSETRYSAVAFASTGARDSSLYATLPDQRFYRILASQSDGALLVAVANDNTSAETLVRLRPLSGRPGRLTNLSVRASVASSLRPLIAGFVTTGTGALPTLVRGLGPSLSSFGVTDALPDTALLLTRDGATAATNDDWPASLATRFTSVGAFPLANGSLDAALESDLSSGNYTAVLTPIVGAPGTGLVELFSSAADPLSTPRRFINLSARGSVAPDRPLIAGFTITGEVPVTVLIRGIGPTLADFGVPEVLADPQLTLFRNSTPLYANDTWTDYYNQSALASATQQVGAFTLPAGRFENGTRVVPPSNDAAMLVTLAPGNYTAVVTGAPASANTTGTALVEVYEVP